jgi:heme exporter protein B
MLFKEIILLIQKEIKLEWREKYAFHGLLLYIVSTVMICYLSFGLKIHQLSPLTWNTLFWIIILFTAVNAIAKSFMQERAGRLLYYYSLVSPQSIILAKIIYNTLLMIVVALIGFGVYSVVLGNPVQDNGLFLLNIVLGAVGFSSTLTMVSGIASKAGNSATLMAVLGFPMIVPLLLMLIKVSTNALDGLAFSQSTDEISVLFALNLMVISLSYILFPYIWRS